MTAALTLPASLAGLAPAWLTEALRSSGTLPAGSVTSVESEVIGAGIGFIGTVARLKLAYDGAPAGVPETVIAKIPSEDPGSRMVGVAFGLYEREVRFYSDLGAVCGLRAPKSYFAHYEAAQGQSVILLEDLRDGAFGDQVNGATPEQMELGLDAIGRFHARWWENPEMDRYPWVTSGIETIRQPIQMMYEAVWRVALERFGELFPAYIRDMVPTLGSRTMAALDQMTLGPQTLIHGDFRPDNIFFGRPGTPDAIVVCDWQGPGRAPGIADAAYFITGSLPVDDRRKHELELLRRYHNLLLEGGVKDYSFDQLLLDFRGYFAGVVAGGVVLLGTLPDGNERGRMLIESTMTRFLAAMEDHDSLALLPA